MPITRRILSDVDIRAHQLCKLYRNHSAYGDTNIPLGIRMAKQSRRNATFSNYVDQKLYICVHCLSTRDKKNFRALPGLKQCEQHTSLTFTVSISGAPKKHKTTKDERGGPWEPFQETRTAGETGLMWMQPRPLWGPPLYDYQHRLPRSADPLIVLAWFRLFVRQSSFTCPTAVGVSVLSRKGSISSVVVRSPS